jgi:hypothetical protein
MNKEELKTVIGSLMSDLRGNWAYDYTEITCKFLIYLFV